MFIDEVEILVKSGKGGDGIIAFHREKHVPLGGPSGGDGGKGGSVIFQADEGMSTLMDLKYQKHIFAKNGEDGKSKGMSGKDADDVIVKVPLGTTVYNTKTNEVLADLTINNQTAIIAQGGLGGKGNKHFATPRNKAPRIQENGEPGIELNLRIELKLLADVGIIGFPSVGKSTLISVCSKAKPKIAEYPFTTIIPNLGVVSEPGIKSFVLADMPGLIEGASSGAGLGIQFLKHIERTRVLIHMIDMSPDSHREPYEDYLKINKELEQYDFDLLKRPQIIAASKMDIPGAEVRLKAFQKQIAKDIELVPISAITNNNVKLLLQKVAKLLEETPFFFKEDEAVDDYVEYVFEKERKDIIINKLNETTYEVAGDLVLRLLARSNLQSDEALNRFLKTLRKAGLDDALREAGAKNNDTIRIGDMEFDFIE